MTKAGWRLLTAVCLVTFGCSSPPTGPLGPRLTFLARPPAVDTIDAAPFQAIVAEVRGDDGEPLSGAVVRFETGRATSGVGAMLVGDLTAASFGDLAVVTTDGRGRAAALVRFGLESGRASVLVSVPVFGLVDSVPFTVSPGAVAGVDIQQRDTTVKSGVAIALRGSTFDRRGNPRSDPLSYTVTSTPSGVASVTSSGEFRSTGSLGVVVVTGTASGKRDTVTVSVFPQGRIAFAEYGTGRILLADLDGANPQVLKDVGPPVDRLNWSPDGSLLGFNIDDGLRLLQIGGETRPLFATLPSELIGQPYSPAFGRHSEEIFFTAVSATTNTPNIWRGRLDGTGLVRITRGNIDLYPSPSPDGRFIVYNELDFGDGGFAVRTADLATNTRTALRVVGTSPTWSPVADLIAYHDGGWITVMRHDGTGRRALFDAVFTPGPVGWSPDGNFLFGPGAEGNFAIDVASGQVVRLPRAILAFSAAWRPEPTP